MLSPQLENKSMYINFCQRVSYKKIHYYSTQSSETSLREYPS